MWYEPDSNKKMEIDWTILKYFVYYIANSYYINY